MRRLLCLGLILLLFFGVHGQIRSIAPSRIIYLKKGEHWFGGAVNEGHKMPFADGYDLNLYADNRGNQSSPLLLSSKGRVIWSDQPFRFSFKSDRLIISEAYGNVIIDSNGHTLASAFKKASGRFFPASGSLPDSMLYLRPQYNTWIELVYNQNEEDILKYAHSIIDNGFPPGVLMIDDNWMPYYGNFTFRKDKFPDPVKMVNELHRMGFKVMLWVCPFISPDTEIFRDLVRRKILLLDNENNNQLTWQQASKPAIINWWNGYSAVLDFTNPQAISWYRGQLDSICRNYAIDGFKFDGGDMEYYPPGAISFQKATPNEQCERWGVFAQYYPLNEYRAMWKRGGEPLVERLRDKRHSWEDVQKLIPHTVAAGLMGYQFTCPDMIGGGEYGSFTGRKKFDEDLVVRSAQISALMPMMQFSVAPWRILDKEHLEAIKKVIGLRMRFTSYISELMKRSAASGEPVVRSLEYMFPEQDLGIIKDQFMLGEKYMITPIVEKAYNRKVVFPNGKWKDENGIIINGPVTLDIEVPIDRLPVYELIKG